MTRMKTVEIGQLKIGEGMPKICVPLQAVDEESLLAQAGAAEQVPCDLLEWRADFLPAARLRDLPWMVAVSEQLRRVTAKPLILTMRTAGEGGHLQMDRREYYTILRDLAEAAKVDVVDIEAFDEQQGFNAEKIEFLVGVAHSSGLKVILSNHDFEGTPEIDVMVKRLIVMQELGADIPKIAVMPREERDVLDLLEAARIMKENYCRRPFIALSMGDLGRTSRVCGGSFGSAITFASGGEGGLAPSAPGQMNARELQNYICQY